MIRVKPDVAWEEAVGTVYHESSKMDEMSEYSISFYLGFVSQSCLLVFPPLNYHFTDTKSSTVICLHEI